MKLLTVKSAGIVLTLTTEAAGHSLLCCLKPGEITPILAEALQQILTRAKATDPRGHPE